MTLLRIFWHGFLALAIAFLLFGLIVFAATLGGSNGANGPGPGTLRVVQPTTELRADGNLARALQLESLVTGKRAPQARTAESWNVSAAVRSAWSRFVAAVRNTWGRFVAASHLDQAAAPMWAMYFFLVLFFALGVLSILNRRFLRRSAAGALAAPTVLQYCAHALPFLGVAGTLLSFMIFAAKRDIGIGGLKEAFLASLSYAAFTTIYGLISSLVLEAWLQMVEE